jgi:hypothetical protein
MVMDIAKCDAVTFASLSDDRLRRGATYSKGSPE